MSTAISAQTNSLRSPNTSKLFQPVALKCGQRELRVGRKILRDGLQRECYCVPCHIVVWKSHWACAQRLI